MQATFLPVTRTVSRGRDTYGYPIVTLSDESELPVKRYRCMGGGYDMLGTVLGQWLTATYQDRLRTVPGIGTETFYGSRVGDDGGVRLDGACGVSSMTRIAEAIGLRLSFQRAGVLVTDDQA